MGLRVEGVSEGGGSLWIMTQKSDGEAGVEGRTEKEEREGRGKGKGGVSCSVGRKESGEGLEWRLGD